MCAFVSFKFLQILSFTCAYWCRDVVLRLLIVSGFFVKSVLGSMASTECERKTSVCVIGQGIKDRVMQE